MGGVPLVVGERSCVEKGRGKVTAETVYAGLFLSSLFLPGPSLGLRLSLLSVPTPFSFGFRAF